MKLPRFDFLTALVTTVLVPTCWLIFRLLGRAVKKWAGYGFEGLLWILNSILMHRLSATISMRQYCRKQLGAERNKYLQVPGQVPGLDVKLKTDDIFVPLTLEYGGHQQGKFSHRDVLSAGTRLRIVGDPGSGKSSLAKKIFRDACAEAMKHPRQSRLPIMIELKEMDVPPSKNDEQSLATWAVDELRNKVKAIKGYRMDEFFDSYVESKGLLILLDGLDEVSGSSFGNMATALIGLSRELEQASPDNVIILTMRTQFHRQISDVFSNDFPPTLYIRSFTPAEIYDFLTRWPFEEDHEHNIARIYSDLTDRPTLREMCSNPLILSMYVANDQASDSFGLPDTRTAFYSKVTEELLVTRRARQMGSTTARTSLREQREAILGRLAFDHLTNQDEAANSLPWDYALKIVSDVVRLASPDAAEEHFRELATETGLITEERRGERFRFIHLTFCEFLAAKHATHGRPNGWTELVRTQKAFDSSGDPQLKSRLTEVIPFACALLTPVHRPDALRDVAALQNQQIMARCFLETQAYDHPSWPSFVKTEIDFFSNSDESEWNEFWLRRLHLFNVVLRDAEQSAKSLGRDHLPTTVGSVFEGLVGRNEERLVKLFSAYATQDAAAAFRLAEAVQVDLVQQRPDLIEQNSAEPPFLALITSRAFTDPARVGLWSTILSEAGLHYRVVAKKLEELDSPTEWRTLVERAPKKRRWSGLYFRQGSLYSDSLTLTTQHGTSIDRKKFPRTRILLRVPPSGRTFGGWRRWIPMGMIGFFLIGMAFYSTQVSMPTAGSVAAFIWYLVPVGIAEVGVGFLLLLSLRHRMLYREIVNQATPRNTSGSSEASRSSGSVEELSTSFAQRSRSTSLLLRIRYRATVEAAQELEHLRDL